MRDFLWKRIAFNETFFSCKSEKNIAKFGKNYSKFGKNVEQT